jgi:hypothetical protein
MIYQLDLFQDVSDIEILEERIRVLEKNEDKLRKALFARHGELVKKYLEINDRLNILEMNICKGGIKF